MYADRVKDTTTAPGTGTITLTNVAPSGYQTFATAFTTGTLVSYCIADQSGTRWEVGTGTFTAPARRTFSAPRPPSIWTPLPTPTKAQYQRQAAAQANFYGLMARLLHRRRLHRLALPPRFSTTTALRLQPAARLPIPLARQLLLCQPSTPPRLPPITAQAQAGQTFLCSQGLVAAQEILAATQRFIRVAAIVEQAVVCWRFILVAATEMVLAGILRSPQVMATVRALAETLRSTLVRLKAQVQVGL
jgi:hypothetical protein